MSDSTQPEPKHLDATKPGIVPASQTSKPALVSTPQLPYDPMMRELNQEVPDKPIQDHKKPDLKPTLTKTNIEAEQAKQTDIKKTDKDQEVLKNINQSKNSFSDQYDQKIQELIDKKTYNLPIKSKQSKLMFGFVVSLLVLIIAGVILLFVF